MTSDAWWRNFFGNKTAKFYWFDLTSNELALVTNTIYHSLENGEYRTVTLFIENIGRGKYALIAIVSRNKLRREEILKAIEEIPHSKTEDWRNGR